MRTDPTTLAHEMHATRQAFGYEYKRYQYAAPKLAELWKHHAPWATGSMVRSASNLSEALMRDVAFRTPGHDEPGIPP